MILRIQYIRVRVLESAHMLDDIGIELPKTRTIVPKVINPTSAYGGRKLRLIINDSVSDFKLSASWHVSTTKRKIGGAGAGRARRYSTVVLLPCSSGGICSAEISL